jgi:hypothetical protein
VIVDVKCDNFQLILILIFRLSKFICVPYDFKIINTLKVWFSNKQASASADCPRVVGRNHQKTNLFESFLRLFYYNYYYLK